jgi:hypothetical protein
MYTKKYTAIYNLHTVHIKGEHTMSNFATLKKSSNSLDRLTKEIEKLNTPASSNESNRGDDRFWKLERDKSGNGSAVIRFLPTPAVDGDDGLPWVRYFDHGFKGPTGKWYIENSLTSLGDKTKDPLGEFNSYLWNLSDDDNSWSRKQARAQKRRLHYVSNIMVISDPKHPENEGKIFLYKFGKKIFDKITLAMNPEFEGDKPVNPFDLWKGANFKLRIRTVDGYPNYDQSLFDAVNPLNDNDDELERVWNKEYSLREFTDSGAYKSYSQLKARLDEILAEDRGYQDFCGNTRPAAPVAAPVAKAVASSEPSWNNSSTEDDDDLEAFRKLAV